MKIPLKKISYDDLLKLSIEQRTQLFVKDKEIEQLKERLNISQTAYLSVDEKINKAIKILGEWTIFETSACTDRIISETLDILKGVDKSE